MHNSCLRINKSSFKNGENYVVGQEGLDLTISSRPGWIHEITQSVNELGQVQLHIRTRKPEAAA